MRARVRNRWTVRAFLLAKLPLALFAGIRVTELDAERCAVTLPYGWRTTNPFHSIYFAAQAAAAEMAAGCMALPIVHAAPEPVSILIVGMEAKFLKKANQQVTFRCDQGVELAQAIAQTLRTGEPVTLETQSVGTMPDRTVVSRFTFSWSFRRKRT